MEISGENRTSPTALARLVVSERSYSGLRRLVRLDIQNASEALERKVERGEESAEITSVYERARVLLPQWAEDKRSIVKFLASGIITAVQFTTSVLEVIPRLETGTRDPAKLVETFEASYPFVTNWASAHLVDFIHLASTTFVADVESLQESFRVSNFQLEVDGKGRKRLALSEEGKGAIKEQSLINDVFTKPTTPTAGCPAMVYFEQGSAVRRLWNWYVEVAREVYPRLYSSPRNDWPQPRRVSL